MYICVVRTEHFVVTGGSMTAQGVQKGARGGPREASEMRGFFIVLKIAAKYV